MTALTPIRSAVWVTLALLTPLPALAQSDDFEHRARALMDEVPLIDGHNDLPWQVREQADGDFGIVDIATPQPQLHTDIERLREGRVGGQFFVAYVPSELIADGAARFALMQIDLIHRMVDRYPDTFALATTADEVEAAFADGRIAALIGLEGGHAIEGSLDVLRTFGDLGVRYITLTHWQSHAWADAATDEPRHDGLSPFGESVIREMNRLGVLVDLSHVSDATMLDALRVSESPVIFSHSSARALAEHVRNVPDSVLRAVGENDGIVMVNYAPEYINDEVGTVDGARATLSQVADHIEHLIAVAGVDHVGFGSDFDGISATPVGLEDVSTFPTIVAELLRRGHSDETVRKILGLNLLRVMRENEAIAARLQNDRRPRVETISPQVEEPEGE